MAREKVPKEARIEVLAKKAQKSLWEDLASREDRSLSSWLCIAGDEKAARTLAQSVPTITGAPEPPRRKPRPSGKRRRKRRPGLLIG